MKAVTFQGYGPPETLGDPRRAPADAGRGGRFGCRCMPAPSPGPTRHHARSSLLRAGRQQDFAGRKCPPPGIDFAGIIDALGAGVTGFAPGDASLPVARQLWHPCRTSVSAPPMRPSRRAAGLRFDQAVVGEGAWYAHGTTSQLDPGQRCLIYGASGGIGDGSGATGKAARGRGDRVVGARHLDLAAQLGADRVVNYEAEDFTALGQTFDLVFDAVGKTSWFACRPLLTPDAIFAADRSGPGLVECPARRVVCPVRTPARANPVPQGCVGLCPFLGGLLAGRPVSRCLRPPLSVRRRCRGVPLCRKRGRRRALSG